MRVQELLACTYDVVPCTRTMYYVQGYYVLVHGRATSYHVCLVHRTMYIVHSTMYIVHVHNSTSYNCTIVRYVGAGETFDCAERDRRERERVT